MHNGYKNSLEKYASFEKRLCLIEKLLLKDKNKDTIDAEVEENMSSQYKILQDMVNNNKDSLTKIEVLLEEIKNNNKNESSKHSSLQESERKRCKWWNRGYCKFKQSCPYLHPKEICITEECLDKGCKKSKKS